MTLIVCPLQFECSSLKRALRACDKISQIVCCGPGAQGIARWSEAITTTPPIAKSRVILAGVCGSLNESLRAGTAAAIDLVCDANGKSWTPPLRLHSGQTVSVTSVDRIVASREERIALVQHSTADLVDCESVPFAKLAESRGWRWGIVRGISDDLNTDLPPGIEHWIAADGRTRILAALATIARHPAMLPGVHRLGHNSKLAMHAAAARISAMSVA